MEPALVALLAECLLVRHRLVEQLSLHIVGPIVPLPLQEAPVSLGIARIRVPDPDAIPRRGVALRVLRPGLSGDRLDTWSA